MSAHDLCPFCPLQFCAPWRPKSPTLRPRRPKRRRRGALLTWPLKNTPATSASVPAAASCAATSSSTCPDDPAALAEDENGARHD